MLQRPDLASASAPFSGELSRSGKAFEEVVHGRDEHIMPRPGSDCRPDKWTEKFKINRSFDEHNIAVHWSTPRTTRRASETPSLSLIKALTPVVNTYRKLLKWQLVGLCFWAGGCIFEAVLLSVPKLVPILVARFL